MKAANCHEFGSPDVLRIEECAEPTAQPGQILVAVAAAGVNFPDVLMVAGKYQSQPAMPFAPGLEFAGTVLSCGDGVTRFRPGDRVMVNSGHGGFAERAVAREGAARRIPAEMPAEVAAGFMVTYGTAYHALRQRADIQPGETLLVMGAAGGVGLAAVELGKAMGARVIAAASNDTKLAAAKDAGADELINYSHGSLRDALKALTGSRGVDVTFDPVGGPLFDHVVRSTAWNGRILIVGFVGGDIPKVATNLLLLKGCQAVGVFYGSFAARDPKLDQLNFEQMFDWYKQGKLKPRIHHIYPLQQAAKALHALADRAVIGKAIVRIDP